MTPKTQYFNGYRFTRGKDGTYYRCAKLKKRMHTYVWEYYNGPVPKGYDIHHIDFDRSNNDISNLQCLPRAEHKRLHSELLTNEAREWRRNNLNINARPKAIEWHKSEDGSKWHSEHIRQQHESGAFKKTLICTNCGKDYIGEVNTNGGNTFCSNACKSAYRRKIGADNIEKVCPICNTTFSTNKYRSSVTCSKSCANRYKWRVKNESKISQENQKETSSV